MGLCVVTFSPSIRGFLGVMPAQEKLDISLRLFGPLFHLKAALLEGRDKTKKKSKVKYPSFHYI